MTATRTETDSFGPLEVFNPFEIWLMVTLIVGISLGGYLLYKTFGGGAGVLLGGLLGHFSGGGLILQQAEGSLWQGRGNQRFRVRGRPPQYPRPTFHEQAPS